MLGKFESAEAKPRRVHVKKCCSLQEVTSRWARSSMGVEGKGDKKRDPGLCTHRVGDRGTHKPGIGETPPGSQTLGQDLEQHATPACNLPAGSEQKEDNSCERVAMTDCS